MASNEPYVFISYAKADLATAEQVEAFLAAKGIRSFRDRVNIPIGKDWSVRIHRALRECDRMVLLLSRTSMPYYKEVHLEWMHFDYERKPIYPLQIEACELFYRLRVYNFIDARADWEGSLARLLGELRAEFTLPPAITAAERVNILERGEVESRTLPEALRALREAVLDPRGSVVLSAAQAAEIHDHKPADLESFRLGRIAEWSLPRHFLDKRFVALTLVLDKGETEAQRWQPAEASRFNDLGEALAATRDTNALALLGAPGSGKSTLLRRLQLDHSIACLRDGDAEQVSLFAPLNAYRERAGGKLPDPRAWLCERWARLYPQLPPLDDWLRAGRALLLLDALNEMPHKSTNDYHRRVGLWRAFAQETAQLGNRIVFSCRSLDYSAPLSSDEMRVPMIHIQPMDAGQVRQFLKAHVPANEARVWRDLENAPQYGLFQTPYFLKLLCDQVEATGEVPRGRAALFTGFVRQALKREMLTELFQRKGLLDKTDHTKLNLFRWRDEFELPERGALIRKLSELAYAMQLRGFETEGAQVRIAYDDACAQLPGEQAEKILAAGIALNVLDKDDSLTEIVFFHQLLQEYFAARRLAKEPRPDLVEVEWSAEKVRPTLPEALSKLADGDPLPPLPQTGWEETTLTAAPMTKDRPGFLRDLMACNLPLAARCAASPEAGADEALKNEIRAALLERTRDPRADLRARIAAGEALGLLGDPRFVRCSGPHGEYLLPPMVEIAAGTYPMGDDKGQYDDEKPACRVTLPAFRIGQFPVTNAEYQCFLDADGYEEPRWWDTAESLDWLSGKGSTEGVKQQWREDRKTVQSWTEEYIRDLVKQNRWTSKEAEAWITWRNWTDEQWEIELEESFPAGKQYRQPDSWDDARFNNPAQPVVGITWFEARAYCNWLTANCGGETIYRLPTEAEFEAAARGAKGRTFPYGDKFDSNRCNTFESHIRRTTPIGVFDNATPEGAYDLSGNAFTWTLSIYDQEKFPYPYRSDDGREDIHQTGIKRVLRGGSWADFHRSARAACRDFYLPAFRFIFFSVFVLLVSVASPFSSDLCLGRCAFRAGAFSASPSCAVGA